MVHCIKGESGMKMARGYHISRMLLHNVCKLQSCFVLRVHTLTVLLFVAGSLHNPLARSVLDLTKSWC